MANESNANGTTIVGTPAQYAPGAVYPNYSRCDLLSDDDLRDWTDWAWWTVTNDFHRPRCVSRPVEIALLDYADQFLCNGRRELRRRYMKF